MAKQWVFGFEIMKFELVECDELLELMDAMIADMSEDEDESHEHKDFNLLVGKSVKVAIEVS